MFTPLICLAALVAVVVSGVVTSKKMSELD